MKPNEKEKKEEIEKFCHWRALKQFPISNPKQPEFPNGSSFFRRVFFLKKKIFFLFSFSQSFKKGVRIKKNIRQLPPDGDT